MVLPVIEPCKLNHFSHEWDTFHFSNILMAGIGQGMLSYQEESSSRIGIGFMLRLQRKFSGKYFFFVSETHILKTKFGENNE